MPNPLLFISHKQTDHAIAKAIAKFIKDESSNEVDIFLSSDPTFKGPRFGANLNAQLREALWKTDAFILVYTSTEGVDWSYCMWECGAAAAPNSAPTTLIVFQCWHDAPKPFDDDLRVNARSLDDAKKFTEQLLLNETFLPRLGKALKPKVERDYIDEAAQRLYNNLQLVLPDIDDGALQQWPAWPYLRVEMPIERVEEIKSAKEAGRRATARALVAEHGIVLDGSERTAELFGLANLAPRHSFKEILKIWDEKSKGAEPQWFYSCCDQIAAAARREFPFIRPVTLKSANGEAEFTPALSRTRRLPFAKVMQFDIYFYNLTDPRALPVTSLMTRVKDVYMKVLGAAGAEAVNLGALLDELDVEEKSRVPLVDEQRRPLYIVHTSMIDRFISKRSRAGATRQEVDALTLADLLAEPGMRQMFESTLAVVGEEATVADVRKAMADDVRDVFVTAGGGRDEPVLGYLTNVDLVAPNR